MVTATLKLSNQEQKIINYLANKTSVAWEELAQFAKDPKTIKLRSIQKAVSDIRKKYKEANITSPFNCAFTSLITQQSPPTTTQTLVKIKTTPAGNTVLADNNKPNAHIDFKLEPYYKRVKTKTAVVNLSDNEWEIFEYLYKNAEKPVGVNELKNLVYKNFGSKTPHCWSDAIARTLTKLRKNLPELKTQNRLLTITGNSSTSYMLK